MDATVHVVIPASVDAKDVVRREHVSGSQAARPPPEGLAPLDTTPEQMAATITLGKMHGESPSARPACPHAKSSPPILSSSTSLNLLATATATVSIAAPPALVFSLLANPLPGPCNGVLAVIRRRVLSEHPATGSCIIEVEHVVGRAGLYASAPARHLVRCDAVRHTVAWSLACQGAFRRWDREWAVVRGDADRLGRGATCTLTLTQALLPSHAPPSPFDTLLEAAVRRQTVALVEAVSRAAAGAMHAAQPALAPPRPLALAAPTPPLPSWLVDALTPAGVDLLTTAWATLFDAASVAQPAAASLVASTWTAGPLAEGWAWARQRAWSTARPPPPPLLALWWAVSLLTGVDASVHAWAHHLPPPWRARAARSILEGLRTACVRAGGSDEAFPPPPPPAAPHWFARPIRPAPPAAAAALASHPVARRPRRELAGAGAAAVAAPLPLEKRWHTLVVEAGEGAARLPLHRRPRQYWVSAAARWGTTLGLLLCAAILAWTAGSVAAAVVRASGRLVFGAPAPPPPPPSSSLLYAIAARDRLAAWARATTAARGDSRTATPSTRLEAMTGRPRAELERLATWARR